MSHSLNVFVVLYLSIVFATVSVFSGSIYASSGDNIVLLAAEIIFFIKMSFDDFAYFSNVTIQRTRQALRFSFLMNILLATSIALTSTRHSQIGAASFSAVLFIGTLWIFDAEDSRIIKCPRRAAWLKINLLSISLLIISIFLNPQDKTTAASVPLIALCLLFFSDFIYQDSIGQLAPPGPALGDSSRNTRSEDHPLMLAIGESSYDDASSG